MNNNIILEGGKGGGGSSFSEQDNTLKANTYVATLEGLGYGLQVGPVNGLKSVYLDDTPLYNSDNTPNFNDVTVEFRTGTPSQSVIKGFELVGTPISVATDVPLATPVTRTTSTAAIDAVAVTIRLPQGLYNQNTTDNKLEKTTLEFNIQTKLTSSGTWTTALNKKYNDKATGIFEESFRINRPSGTGTWDVRVVRVTADSAASTLKNLLNWAYYTEYQAEAVTYPSVALMGITLNAAGVNSTKIPTRSVDWYGRIIQVPNNFDTNTRIYTGVWNLATFKNVWCNDPAWVLYDLATDATVGLGLTASQVDLASFYAASVYNSAQVSYTGLDAVEYTGPRFSFNAPLTAAASPIDWMKRVASVMNATLMWINGLLTIVQDRPETYAHVFTNANVIGGRFSRAGTPEDTRYTVANVTWNAPADGYKQRVTSVEDAAGIATYGYIETNVAAFGCTSMSQAIRYGKWILDTSLYTTNTISFTTGEIGAAVIPGQVIRVFDNTFAGVDLAGRVLAGCTTTSILLDRSVTIAAGSKITIWGMDGTIYSDATITTTGTVSTLTLTSALAVAPAEGSIFQITTTTLSPELYRVIDREEIEEGKYQITAGEYDANKWARIEGGTVLPTPVYSDIRTTVVSAPTALTFSERNVYVDLKVQRLLHIGWSKSQVELITGYRVIYSINGGQKVVVDTKLPYIEIEAGAGDLQISVQAKSYTAGVLSTPLTGTYTIAATETTGSTLNAVTNLFVYGTAGTTFTTRDLIFQWTNPTTNGQTKDAVVRFKVEIYNGASLLRSDYAEYIAPGQIQTYTYSYDDNIADGGPRRSITVKVYAQDAARKLSSVTTATFTNAAPVAPSGLTVTGGVGQVFVTCTAPTDNDYKGTIVWASLTNGFTPASGNVVYDGSDNLISFKMLGSGVHYVKVAHYDSFGKDYTGTGLNLSAQTTATPVSNAGIPSGTSNPVSGTEGDLFFNTTDGKLYRYHSSAWTTAVPTLDLTGTITTTQITDSAITTPKIATNAITTNKLFVAGRGQEMNADPTMTDTTAWSGSSVPTLNTGLTDIPTGGSTAVSNATNSAAVIISTDYIPLDASFNYRIETTAKQLSGTTGVVYFGVIWYDSAKVALSSAGATGWTGSGTGSYFVSGVVLPTTWTSYSVGFGPNETAKQHPSAKFVRLVAFLNNTSVVGSVCAVARHALIRKTAGEVIVDGTLSASKLVANSITAGQIAASTITTNEIAANTITGGDIAATTITAANIAANTITASQIAANTITASKIAANTITASQIAAATITGTQIAAGTITASNITTSTITTDRIQVGAVAQSSVSIAASGTLSALSAATTTRSGTLSGPSLTTTGRNVTVGFSGSAVVYLTGTAARVVRVSPALEIWNGGTFVTNIGGYTIGDYYDVGLGIFDHALTISATFNAPAAATLTLKLFLTISCYDPATGFLNAYLTRLDAYGDFFISEIKV